MHGNILRAPEDEEYLMNKTKILSHSFFDFFLIVFQYINIYRAGDGIAAKVEFNDTRERVVASRARGFHDPNEISCFQLPVGL